MARRRTFGVILLVALLLTVGIAYASIPGPDGVIHGCYKNNNPAQGAVIVVDHAASCPSGYTALNWNQTGPQGPPGLSGIQTIAQLENFDVLESPTVFERTINCPAGKVALGGGGYADATAEQAINDPLMQRSYPYPEGSATSWVVRWRFSGAVPQQVQIQPWVVCASAS